MSGERPVTGRMGQALGSLSMKRAALALTAAFGIMLCSFLIRCYYAQPWDEWMILGVPAAFWRKPIAAALLIASVWGVGLTAGGLFWWMVSWVVGAKWSAGVRRLWENWANAGLGAWIMLIATVCILQTVLYPWADALRDRTQEAQVPDSRWFYNPVFFLVRQMIYLLAFKLTAMHVRLASLLADMADVNAYRRYQCVTRLKSAICLPVLVVFAGLMGIDWISGLTHAPVFSMWPLYFLSWMAVGSLGATVATSALTAHRREGSRTGLERGHLGGLLLAALLFKLYFGFSGYMIVAYAGIPGELQAMDRGMAGGWECFAWITYIFGFVLPVLFLLLPAVRRSGRRLAAVGAWVAMASLSETVGMVAPYAGFALNDPMLWQCLAMAILIVCTLLGMGLLPLIFRNRSFAVDHDQELM